MSCEKCLECGSLHCGCCTVTFPSPPCSKICGDCGEAHEPSWLDRLFGCKRDRLPKIKLKHSIKGDCRDYRDDLARFPGDPEAFTDGPRAVAKLWDKRQRQGWHRRDRAELDSSPPAPAKNLAREAYNRAKAKGFRPDQEIA